MTVVIAAINGKGGAGKTTALMNIAGEYALHGRQVAMIDMDASNNLMKWWTDCQEKQARPEGIEVYSHKTARGLERWMEENTGVFDHVVIDTPGEDTSIMDSVIAAADLVISPIQPSKREVLGAIDSFESVLRVNEALGKTCRHGVLRNCTERSGQSSRTKSEPICSAPRCSSAMSTRTSTTASARFRCRR
jgi:chromosome partitioning protein